MRKLSTGIAVKQSGFTLIELIIVIIIIGILAAVAIPKLSNISDSANRAANKAVLGMAKSAWSAAYAVTKVTPTLIAMAAQTSDPACTVVDATLSCPVGWLSATGLPGQLIIKATDLTTTTSIACNTAADCD